MSEYGYRPRRLREPRKGTQKENIGTAVFLEDWGIQGDAHAGKWHRQVSLLSRKN